MWSPRHAEDIETVPRLQYVKECRHPAIIYQRGPNKSHTILKDIESRQNVGRSSHQVRREERILSVE